MNPVTIRVLVTFLSQFDLDTEVLINSDSGTPDPSLLPNILNTVYFLGKKGSEEIECHTVEWDEVEEYLQNGYEIKSVKPLLYPV